MSKMQANWVQPITGTRSYICDYEKLLLLLLCQFVKFGVSIHHNGHDWNNMLSATP